MWARWAPSLNVLVAIAAAALAGAGVQRWLHATSGQLPSVTGGHKVPPATEVKPGSPAGKTQLESASGPQLPLHVPAEVPRDIGYLDPAELMQLEALIQVKEEMAVLPVKCAVCRVTVFEGLLTAVQYGAENVLKTPQRAQQGLKSTLHALCDRMKKTQLLGRMKRRVTILAAVCSGLIGDEQRFNEMSSAAARLAHTVSQAVSRGTAANVSRIGPVIDNTCASVCSRRHGRISMWAAMIEALLGLEPIEQGLLNPAARNALRDETINPLLYFAAAKSDETAARLLVALGRAQPDSVQQHTGDASLSAVLGRPLARLMSKPTIEHQINFLRMVHPTLFDKGSSDLDVFLQVAAARLDFHIDGSVNDTAIHIASYGYDHNVVVALLLGCDSDHCVDAVDTHGRTPLHYATDAQSQTAALVNVFAEPPKGKVPVLTLRSSPPISMASDHAQNVVVSRLEKAQLKTVQLLLAFGANPNAHVAVTGSTPLHLAARSGATAVVELLLKHGAEIESRNRHGATPLIVASVAGHTSTCSTLIKAGARVDARDARARNAAWYARASASAMEPKDILRLFGTVKSNPQRITRTVDIGHSGGWGTKDNQSAIIREDFDICDVDQRDHRMSAAVFESDYLHANRPLLLVNATLDMPASRSWTRSNFFKKVQGQVFGPQKLPVRKGAWLPKSKGGQDISLSDYFDGVERGQYAKKLCWNNPRNDTVWHLLKQDLAWPDALLTPTTKRSTRSSGTFGLFVGPQGSGISMHHHKATWNALLFGRKLWILTPPPQSTFHRDELAEHSFSNAGHGWLNEALTRKQTSKESMSQRNGRLYVVQHSGDILFVPAGWGHSTLNLQESVGVANFFLDEDAAGYRPAKIFHSNRGIRSLQTAAGISAPSDMHADGHP